MSDRGPNPKADLEEIRRAVALFLEEGSVIELRAPKTPRDGVISGYFSDPEKLARGALSIGAKAPGVYVTLNPVLPDLLARAHNGIVSHARALTTDADITHRRWLLFDFDPRRPAGISSTDPEHNLSLESARSAQSRLTAEGWPEPVYGDSGNGGHLLYRIDLPNDPVSLDLIRCILQAAAQRHATPAVDVDITVYNASRISKVYGTVARKGDSLPDRPHRLSRILSMPAELTAVSVDLLRQLAAEVKIDLPRKSSSPRPHGALPALDLEQWIRQHGVEIERGPDIHQGSRRWVLKNCPFNPAHAAPDAAVFQQLQTGRLGFKCLHNSCADKDWIEFREFYEPGYRNRSRSGGSRSQTERPVPPAVGPQASAASDVSDEIPLSSADVEAAADAAIAADDVVSVMRLAPEVARLKPVERAVVTAKLREHFKRRFHSRDFERAMKAAGEGNGSGPADDDGPLESGEGPNLLCYPLTDVGNGERIVALYGDEIRYCVEMKRWLVWDGTRWAVDELNVMRQKAKTMARRTYAQGKGNSSFETHARATESYAAISSAIGSAATEKGIPISAAELDRHPYLLNCPNGVLDLRDGKLLPHNREFLITKLCPVPYQPLASCPRFIDFVQWAMGANPEGEPGQRTARLVGFIQRAFGYSLTSDVSEKAIFVLHGEGGNNGKTTLLTIFRDLLGKDYSGQLVIDTVMAMKNQDATTRADLADLRGVRLVVTSEVEKEHRLSEGKIKYITAGMGSIKSCRKYENPIEFEATHKLFMDCNHRPTVRGVDDAIWRRLKLIPFLITISDEEKDERLKDKLRVEMPGILAWAVQGCIEWFNKGLGDPPEVSEAGHEWREHDDPLKEFIEDCCRIEADLFVKATDLTAAYERWARQTRERFPLGREALAERLHAKGLVQSRSRRIDGKQARTWEGIELLADVAREVRNAGWPEKE